MMNKRVWGISFLLMGILSSTVFQAAIWGVHNERVHQVAAGGNLDEVKAWVKVHGVNGKDSYDQSLLFIAADENHFEVARFLLDKGALVDAASATGLTPLHVASGKGHVCIVRLLLSSGASVYAKNQSGETPLDWAKKYAGNKEVIALLEGAMKK